ncbi:KAP family P-loop NTPase fold protein [Magnetococcales bacterium HHB-1]
MPVKSFPKIVTQDLINKILNLTDEREFQQEIERLAPKDKLGHERLSMMLLEMVNSLPNGSVIALEGTWGRGKTDVMTRMVTLLIMAHRQHALAREYKHKYSALRALAKDIQPHVIWINPWEHTDHNLVQPIIAEIGQRTLDQLSQAEGDENWKQKTGKALSSFHALFETTLQWGKAANTAYATVDPVNGTVANMALKTGSAVLNPLKKTISRLSTSTESEVKEQINKIKSKVSDTNARHPGHHLDVLVSMYLNMVSTDAAPLSRLVVCIDDLDRCLPHQIVPFLESIFFLTSSNAPIVFILAVDPVALEQAVRLYYNLKSSHHAFRAQRYLDKVVTTRLELPAIPYDGVGKLMRYYFDHNKMGRLFCQRFELNGHQAAKQIQNALSVEGLRNPRVLEKLQMRLYHLAVAHVQWFEQKNRPDKILLNKDRALFVSENIYRWLAIRERWPALRDAMAETVDIQYAQKQIQKQNAPEETEQDDRKKRQDFEIRFNAISSLILRIEGIDRPSNSALVNKLLQEAEDLELIQLLHEEQLPENSSEEQKQAYIQRLDDYHNFEAVLMLLKV